MRVEIRVLTEGRPLALAFDSSRTGSKRDIKVPPEVATPSAAEDLDPAGGAAGEVRGVVRASDGSSIAGRVCSLPTRRLRPPTDTAGRIRSASCARACSLQLRVAADGYDTDTEDVSVPSGGATTWTSRSKPSVPRTIAAPRPPWHQISRDSQFLTLRGAPPDRT